MNKEAIVKIKDGISALDACQRYGIGVNRAGFARCLFHQEKTPSMKVYAGTGGFHCFGCGAGGSVIDLVMQAFKIDVPSACQMLNRDFGLGLDLEDRPRRRMTKGEQLAQAKKEYEERRARKKAEQHLTALESAYNEAECEAIKVLRDVAFFDPKRVSGEITNEYAEAVRRLPVVLYEAEEAERELYETLGIGRKIG